MNLERYSPIGTLYERVLAHASADREYCLDGDRSFRCEHPNLSCLNDPISIRFISKLDPDQQPD